jgi:hypothetical protein
MYAMAGGVVLSLGNLSTQYAFALVGLSVTEVITASITVVIGISLTVQSYNKITNYNLVLGLNIVLVPLFCLIHDFGPHCF